MSFIQGNNNDNGGIHVASAATNGNHVVMNDTSDMNGGPSIDMMPGRPAMNLMTGSSMNMMQEGIPPMRFYDYRPFNTPINLNTSFTSYQEMPLNLTAPSPPMTFSNPTDCPPDYQDENTMEQQRKQILQELNLWNQQWQRQYQLQQKLQLQNQGIQKQLLLYVNQQQQQRMQKILQNQQVQENQLQQQNLQQQQQQMQKLQQLQQQLQQQQLQRLLLLQQQQQHMQQVDGS